MSFLWHFPAGFPGSALPTTLLCDVRTFLEGRYLRDCSACGEEHSPIRPDREGRGRHLDIADVKHADGVDKGIDYGVQDFLEGSKREKFQADFTQELVRVGRSKDVKVHSAFIRNIVIPEERLPGDYVQVK